MEGGIVAASLARITQMVMVFSPVVPYWPQYDGIRRSKNAESFSPFVCLILIVANVLRIAFWLGKRFDVILLWQSLFMVLGQLIMLELCVRLKPKKLDKPRRTIGAMQVEDFWQWDDMASYLFFLLGFSGACTVLCMVFLQWAAFFEFVGAISLAIEATLGIPQFYRNYVKGSTEGLSTILIGSWFIGDAFKTLYFVKTAAPQQFVYCGVTQLIVDSAILYQFYAHRQRKQQKSEHIVE